METLIEAKARVIQYGLSAIKRSPELYAEFDQVFMLENGGESCGCAGEVTAIFERWSQEVQTKQITMEVTKKEFVMTPGVKHHVDSNEYYTNHNMTDEIAIAFLKENQNRIKWFEKFPENWQDLIAGKQEKKQEPVTPKTESKSSNKPSKK